MLLSTPSNYSVLSNHFINSFLVHFLPIDIENFLSSKKNKVDEVLLCPKCGIAPILKLIKKEEKIYYCKCGENLEIKSSKPVSAQSLERYFSMSPSKTEKQVLLLFCLDYSGSMSNYYKTPKNKEIQDYVQEMSLLLSSKYQMGSSCNENIIRKSIMLYHVRKQLEILFQKKSDVSYKIFVITFSNVVKLFGNGSNPDGPVVLEDEDLKKIENDFEKCESFGKKHCNSVYDPTNHDMEHLMRLLEQEEEGGSTSLGPAVATGLGVVRKLKPSACQFFIFTDGMASNGIGNIEKAIEKPQKAAKCQEEYENLGRKGLKLGVTFHLFSFADEQAGLKFTTKLVDKTIYGYANRVAIINNKDKTKTYDHEKLDIDLANSFNLTEKLYAIPQQGFRNFKIFHDNGLKIRFCQKDNENCGETKEEDYVYIWKNFGPLYDKMIKFGVIYELPPKFKEKNLNFQIQIKLTRFTDKQDFTIFLNFSSELIPKLHKKIKIDFNPLTNILSNNRAFENQEILDEYIKFMEEFGDNNDLNILKKFSDLPIKRKSIVPTKKNSDSDFEDNDPTNFHFLNQMKEEDPTDFIYLNQKNKDKKLGSVKKIGSSKQVEEEEEKKMEYNSDEDEKTLDLRLQNQKKDDELNKIIMSSYPPFKK